MRIRLTFSKTPAMRFTGHMDLHRSLERTLRRAGLPLTHSQGYTKRPKIHIASALPLGVMGEQELADVWLDGDFDVSELLLRIQKASPPGIRVHRVEVVPEEAPNLQQVIEASEFLVTLMEPVEGLDERIARLLAAETLPRERRGKPYDLRPLILQLERVEDDGGGRAQLAMTLRTEEGATGRPDEVVAALGGDPLRARMRRVTIHLSQPSTIKEKDK